MTDTQKQFLDKAAAAATLAGCPFPRMAAAEAALESGYGLSALASDDNNLFGLKQREHPNYPTVSLPTREFEQGQWIETSANWVKYPDWQSCFSDRLDTLTRLSHCFPHYAAALRASDVETYIREVSASWSTDPKRADKCLAIYQEYLSQLSTQGAD